MCNIWPRSLSYVFELFLWRAHSTPPPNAQLLERMPALDEADHARDRLGGAEVKPSGAVPAEGQGPLITAVAVASPSQASGPASGGDDLLGGLDGGHGCSFKSRRHCFTLTAPPASFDTHGAFLGAPVNSAAAAAVLEDLLGGGGGDPPAVAQAPAPAVAAASLMDLLSGSPARPPPNPTPEPMFPPITAFQVGRSICEKMCKQNEASYENLTFACHPLILSSLCRQHAASGVTVAFSFTKPAGNEALTEITAQYLNTGLQGVTEFNLQVGEHGRDKTN